MQKLISYILPAYNVEKYITDCMTSIVQQDILSEEYEIIVVNDGSTDKSAEILDKLSKKYDFIHVINQENQGSGYAETMELQMHVVNILHFLMRMTDTWIMMH